MRALLRAGLLLGLVAAACKDSAGPPGDFSDPVAATGIARLRPAATLLSSTLPRFDRSTGRVAVLGAVQAQRLQQLRPAMNEAAAQGIIPDSVYGRVFQWDTALDTYTW